MMRKKLIFILILALFFSFFYQNFFKKNKKYEIFQVKKGDIFEEVSASGKVKIGEKINFNFKNSGRIEKIKVRVGDRVKSGQVLSKLETGDLENEIEKAKISLQISKTNLEIAKEKLDLTQNLLESAKTNLRNNFKDASLKSHQAFLALEAFNLKYAQSNFHHQDWVKLIEAKDTIQTERDNINKILLNENINYAFFEIQSSLQKIWQALKIFRETIGQEIYYKNLISLDDYSAIHFQESQIILAEQKLENSQNDFNVAKENLKLAQQDLNLAENKVKEAEIFLKSLQDNFENSFLQSPVDGVVVEISKNEGEIIHPAEKFIVLLSEKTPFIEAEIAQVDIGKIKKGQVVKIQFDGIENEIFKGEIFEMEPAETEIGGVVYYKVKITILDKGEKIKPGMTADLSIVVNEKKGILTLPQRAIFKKDDKEFVFLLKGNKQKEIEVKTGLKGEGGEVEIISPLLKEGDRVIVFSER